MTTQRLLYLVSAILFIVAAVIVLAKASGIPVEAVALFAFAAWVGAGAL